MQVQYEVPVFVTEINIYETYNGGCITKISAKKADNIEVVLWSNNYPQAITQSRIFSVPLKVHAFTRLPISRESF